MFPSRFTDHKGKASSPRGQADSSSVTSAWPRLTVYHPEFPRAFAQCEHSWWYISQSRRLRFPALRHAVPVVSVATCEASLSLYFCSFLPIRACWRRRHLEITNWEPYWLSPLERSKFCAKFMRCSKYFLNDLVIREIQRLLCYHSQIVRVDKVTISDPKQVLKQISQRN